MESDGVGEKDKERDQGTPESIGIRKKHRKVIVNLGLMQKTTEKAIDREVLNLAKYNSRIERSTIVLDNEYCLNNNERCPTCGTHCVTTIIEDGSKLYVSPDNFLKNEILKNFKFGLCKMHRDFTSEFSKAIIFEIERFQKNNCIACAIMRITQLSDIYSELISDMIPYMDIGKATSFHERSQFRDAMKLAKYVNKIRKERDGTA